MDDSQSPIDSKHFDTYENIAADQEAFKLFLRDYTEVCNAEEFSKDSLAGFIAKKNESFINPYDESHEERNVRRFCHGYLTVAKDIMFRRLETWKATAACFTITCTTDIDGLLLLRKKGHWTGNRIRISHDCKDMVKVKNTAEFNSIKYAD